MRYGSTSSRHWLNNTACSSQTPSVASEHPALAARYALYPEAVAKRHARQTALDAPWGRTGRAAPCCHPLRRRSSSSSGDAPSCQSCDIMGAPRDAISKLTRSALHPCLQRRGISRLTANEEKVSKRGGFAETRIGCTPR